MRYGSMLASALPVEQKAVRYEVSVKVVARNLTIVVDTAWERSLALRGTCTGIPKAGDKAAALPNEPAVHRSPDGVITDNLPLVIHAPHKRALISFRAGLGRVEDCDAAQRVAHESVVHKFAVRKETGDGTVVANA